MKFKIGDKVRLTREALYNKFALATKEEIFGGEISNVDKDGYYTIEGFEDDYLEQSLERIPEKCKFEYGEVIEVTNGIGEWVRAIFVMALPNTVKYPFICVKDWDENSFHNGSTFYTSNWEYARKLQPKAPQITRKEIAHKLGISEDFVLIDEVIIDGI